MFRCTAILPLCLVLALAAHGRPAGAQTRSTDRETLTNALVIEMVAAKLPDDVILAKIRSTANRFDLTARGLVALQKAGVPAAVLRAMTESDHGAAPNTSPRPSTATLARPPERPVESSGASASTVEQRASNAGDPEPPAEPGIYMWQMTEAGHRFTLLEPSVFTQAKSGGWLKTSLTYGIAKHQTKAVLRGQNASLYTTDPSVAFYFVFERRTAGLSESGANAGTSSPNEFTLLRLSVTRTSRETVVGSANAYGASSGVDEKNVVPFTVTRLRPGVYRVVPNSRLTLGEYAFTTASTSAVFVPGLMAKDRVFDFGVGERR